MSGGLEEEIELMREAMVDAASREGVNADITMEYSRKLDHLINRFEAQKEARVYGSKSSGEATWRTVGESSPM